MSRIACIGARTTPPDILQWMILAGAEIVRAGHTLVSGNAPGADQAWARGGNSVDPTKVELCLPWLGFEPQRVRRGNVVRILDTESPEARDMYFDLAITLGDRRAESTPRLKLLACNAMILLEPPGTPDKATRVLAYGVRNGGTRQACRIAKRFAIPVHDVSKLEIREAFDMAAINGPIFP